jgi:hypothetical protein
MNSLAYNDIIINSETRRDGRQMPITYSYLCDLGHRSEKKFNTPDRRWWIIQEMSQ